MISSSFPKRLMTCNPSPRLFEGSPAQPKMMEAAFDFTLDYPGTFQDFQVFGNGGLGGAEVSAELTGTVAFTARERMDHRTAGAVGQSVKGYIKSSTRMHSHMTIYQCEKISQFLPFAPLKDKKTAILLDVILCR